MTNEPVMTVRGSISLPGLMSVSIAAGLGLQVLGVYAIWATFGAWPTFGFYAIGGLAILLQRVIAGRRLSCSAGA